MTRDFKMPTMEVAALFFVVLFTGLASSADVVMSIRGMPEKWNSNMIDDSSASGPSWSQFYSVNGLLELPYAEIKEPFTAYFDAKTNRSRIDYYNKIVMTVQRADMGKYGATYKIAPMSTETVMNVQTCFLVNGTINATVAIQSVLPDLTGFTRIKSGVMCDVNYSKQCDLWQNITYQGKKKNTYNMYLYMKNRTAIPVRYEMLGFDSLLGSHYDRYYIDYFNYDPADQPTNATFTYPYNKMTCAGFPGPGATEHRLLMNPMQEYIHRDQSHVDYMFNQFKSAHNKNYDGKEHEVRKHKFMHNVRFIHSQNRANLGYRLKINHLADWTDEERNMLRGYRKSKGYNGGLPFEMNKYDLTDIPKQMDWRLWGAVTQVKDQAVCGSCWSFGTSGTVEGKHFLKTGERIRLSQQELMDCSWGEGNNACDGGEDFRAYQYIMKNGLASEDSYGPYLGQDARCHVTNVTAKAHIKGYVNVTKGDQQALKVAIAKEGPISVSIDASHPSFSFYADGVYYDAKCGNTDDDLDHSVLAVGYGMMNGQMYWLVKNSWSTHWGNDGYVLMSWKNNNCGVATAPTFVNM